MSDQKALEKLKTIAGENSVRSDEPMAAHTTFRIGGPADYYVCPPCREALIGTVQACREEDIKTCCESCLQVDWDRIEMLLPWTDLWIADIKIMDSAMHKEYTGAGNEQILENLKKMAEAGAELILRIPVIPGVNDTLENIDASADFILNELAGKVRTLQLLSFMRLGQEKYESLKMPYQMKDVRFRRDYFQKKIQKFADYLNGKGIHTLVGTREKV